MRNILSQDAPVVHSHIDQNVFEVQAVVMRVGDNLYQAMQLAYGTVKMSSEVWEIPMDALKDNTLIHKEVSTCVEPPSPSHYYHLIFALNTLL